VDRVCLVIPVLSGKREAALDFFGQLEGEHKPAYDRSERRIGISKEVWFLAPLPQGEALVGYIESDDFAAALAQFSGSQDVFDLWFKQRLLEATGLDLNNPPQLELPQLLSYYSGDDAEIV
jgi:hypothetical protein